jgi:hypothetical protein
MTKVCIAEVLYPLVPAKQSCLMSQWPKASCMKVVAPAMELYHSGSEYEGLYHLEAMEVVGSLYRLERTESLHSKSCLRHMGLVGWAGDTQKADY